MVLYGPGSVFGRGAGVWTVTKPGAHKLRVTYRGIESNWATVQVR
jgi:hypothetical protein